MCLALKTNIFLGCGVNSNIVKQFEEVMAKRGDSTAAGVHWVVVVNSLTTTLDRTSVQQLRKSVSCGEIRVIGGKLPGLL